MITISTAMKSLPIGIGMILLMSNTLFSTVTGNDIFINPWQLKAPNQPYDNYNATVGDTITFFWATTENHTVYINPTGNCNDTGSILVGSNSPASYTFLESDAKNSTDGKPVFFADNIAQLCEWGMRFVVNLIEQSDSGNTTNTTMAPIPSPTYDSTTATPSSAPTISLTLTPSQGPTDRTTTTKPSLTPSYGSTGSPSDAPIVITGVPSSKPSFTPSSSPTVKITVAPTNTPTNFPTTPPVPIPTAPPTSVPTPIPTGAPTPTPTPTAAPVVSRTPPPTTNPTEAPVLSTLVPTANPTFAPTAKPTAPPTDAAAVVTNTPTRAPIEQKTISPTYALTTQEPTEAPNESTQKISQTLKGLQMRMAGITDLPTAARVSWEELTESFSTSYVFNDMKGSVSNFVTTYEVTDISPIPLQRHQRMMRGNQRGLETQGIFVEYTQTVEYDTIDPNKFTPNLIVTSPFKTDDERTAYVTLLGTSPNDLLSQVSGVSEIQIQDVNPASPPESVSTDAPSTAPKKGIDLTKPAIIGIACGGAAILILCLIFCIYCCQSGGDSNGGSDGRSSGEPPLHVSVRDDEVSTLAGGPQTGTPMYGDQSVATMDYDYSKAYGGAGDTSVSSAGGTFGSNTQNISLPANAAATGAALGAMDMDDDDNASYDAQYNQPRANTKDEIIHIFAPPGKLGVVIDTPDDGAPVVHAVKDTSVIADRIIVGDKLVAVDDEDVRSMTAIKVSKMISRKGANPSRKLTIIRTAPIEE